MSRILRIGLLIGLVGDPFWVQVLEAVYRKAQQLILDLILIDEDLPLLPSFEDEAALFDELLALELDTLIGWGFPGDLAQRALAAGIPIIHLTETEIRHPLSVSPLGLSEVAQIAAELLVEKLNRQGHVLVVGGLKEPGREDGAKSRIEGFYQVIERYSGITTCQVPTTWRYEEAYQVLASSLNSGQGVFDAVFGLSDTLAFAGRDAGRDSGLVDDHTLILGINGDPLALAAIAEGSMTATIETSADYLGCQAVELAYQAAQGLSLPKHFPYQVRTVTAENITEVAAQKLLATAMLPDRLVGFNRRQEQKRLVQLETSLEINRRVGSILDPHQISREIANLIRTNYAYNHVRFYRWSKEEQAFTLDDPGPSQVGQGHIPLEQSGLLAEALARTEPLFIPDVLRSSRFLPDPNWPDTRSRVIVPIRFSTEILGVLDMHSYQAAQHSRHELVGLQILADQLGIAIRNAELYREALQAREEALLAKARAEKADHLKTRLLANVSHELRTPLNIIMGFSQAALSIPNPYNAELPEKLRQDLGYIYDSGEHLIRLINDLLDLSRAEIDELDLFSEAVSPRALLEEAFHSIISAVSPGKNGITWRLELPAHMPLIQADPVRLRQILLNLLSNAHKFTPAGEIVLGAEVLPPHVHIWVQDTGIGIPVDVQERIFEPFMTAEKAGRRHEGIGLGLTITRRLVALHGGSLTLESQPEKGSTFHVYLPLPSLSNQLAQPLPRSGAQPVLLVVCASDYPAEAITELSQRQGLQVCLVQPDDDLNQLIAQVQPNALAWDLAHARPGDWSLIQKLRTHPQICQLPFLLYGQDLAEEAAGCPAVTNVLLKPLSGKTLQEVINSLQPARSAGPILIVDDDLHAQQFYRSMVETEFPGYPIQVAGGGAAALDCMAAEIPSLVILDLLMPEIDGFQVLEHMRANPRTSSVPVLVLSGRMLSYEDVKRLDHARVTFQSKDVLADHDMLACLRQALVGAELLPQPTSVLVKQAIAHIHQNFDRTSSLLEIAETIGVSKSYLSRIFRAEMHIPLWEYLNQFRVLKAKELLRSKDMGVTDIAVRVGFADASYFGRVFRKCTGRSPRSYRQQPE